MRDAGTRDDPLVEEISYEISSSASVRSPYIYRGSSLPPFGGVGSLAESELGRTRPAPGGTGPPASLTGWRTPITTPREGRQFRAHKLPPPLRGEGRNICDLRSASGPTTRRFSLRKTSIWGPPPREGGP